MSASAAPGLDVVRSSPYKGLVPYSEADAAFFFGRSTEREIVVANLLASRLTLLYGASGVGKSSLLQAGVASYLRRGPKPSRTARRSPELLVVFNRWTGDPVRDLIAQIDRTCAEAGLGDAAVAAATGDGSATLPEMLQRWSARLDVDFLVVLDQFEEYFLYHEHEDGPDTFAVQFPSAVNRADLRANFLVAMREDQLAKLDRFKGRIPQLFDNTLRITHLGYQAARAAIEQPLEAYNRLAPEEHPVTVQPEVIDTILEDVQVGRVQLTERGQGGTANGPGETASNSPIEAPYLQLVMTTLWAEERRRGSQVLRAETLHSLGGAQRIVRTHLADAMDSLNRQEQDVAAAVFRYLVTPSGSKISYSDQDLADYAGLPQTAVTPVLQKLSSGDVRILRPVGDSLHRAGGSNYEIFHDVLAPAILDWRARYVQQREAELELARRLEHEAEERRAVEEQARIYRRRAQRRGAFVLGMALVLVVVVALAVVSVQQRNTARRANNAARASALSSQATALLATDPAESARVAAEALKLDRSAPNAERVLRQALGASHIRQIVSRDSGSMTGAAFTQDGRYVVAAGDGGTVSVHSLDGQEPARMLRMGAPSSLRSPPAFIADDQAVVATTLSGQTYLWRWKSGRGAAEPLAIDVVATAVDPGNDRVATADRAGMIQVWDSSGHRLRTLFSGQRSVTSLAFSPKGTLLASGGQLGLSLRAWATGKDKLPPDGGAVFSVAFDADGNYLAAAGDGGARVWASAGGTWQPKELDGARSARGRIVRFSPDGRRLAMVKGSAVEIWDVEDGSHDAVLSGHSDSILNLAFNDNGFQIITAGVDATARVWETVSGGELFTLRGHAGAVFDARFSPDGKLAVTTGADGTVRLWDVSTGSSPLKRHFRPAQNAAFGPMGTAVTASADTTACLIQDLRGHQQPQCPFTKNYKRLPRDRSIVMDARMSADGNNVITAHSDGAVAVWRTGAKDKTPLLVTRPDERFPVYSAAVNLNGDEIAFGAGPQLFVWKWRDVSSRPRGYHWRSDYTEPVAVNDSILDVEYGPGKYDDLVLTAHADGTVRLWTWKTDSSGRKTDLTPESFPKLGVDVTYEAKFSRAGDRIVTANGDGVARVWDTASRRLLHKLKNASGRALTSVDISPDGNWVIAGDAGGDILIWEIATEKLLAVLPRHGGTVNSVQFNPTGDGRILSAGDDGAVRLSTCTTCGSIDDLLVAAKQLAK